MMGIDLQKLVNDIQAETEKDGLLPVSEECVLTPSECRIVRKILQCANTMFTVADHEYHDNKLDAIIRKLRRYEDVT